MSKNRTYKQKRLASQPAGAKCVRPVRQFAETGTMYVDFNETLQVKEDSP
jgi:hypothetical protein